MPRKDYEPKIKDGKLVYFPIWASNTILHFNNDLDFDLEVLGIKLVLWSYSTRQDPPGTLPDDTAKWARWIGRDVRYVEARKDLITASWKLDGNKRWIIRRIYDIAKLSATRSKAGSKKGSKEEQKGNTLNILYPSILDPISISKEEEEYGSKSPAIPDPNSWINPAIKEVYRYYLEKRGMTPGGYKLTTARRDKIRTRLVELKGRVDDPVQYAKHAIDGTFATPWNNGSDPKTGGKTYLDLAKHVFRSEEQTEERLHAAADAGLIAEE